MANKVSVEKTDKGIVVSTPYHPQFPAKARAIGGKWDALRLTWTFDLRDEERVRALCVAVYGTDGATVELVTLRYRVTPENDSARSLYVAGREVAHRGDRDAAVRLGEGVVLIEGSFPGSGGSRNNPLIIATGNSSRPLLEIRDVPRTLAEQVVADNENAQIVEERDSQRAALEARLAEIEAEAARIRETLATL